MARAEFGHQCGLFQHQRKQGRREIFRLGNGRRVLVRTVVGDQQQNGFPRTALCEGFLHGFQFRLHFCFLKLVGSHFGFGGLSTQTVRVVPISRQIGCLTEAGVLLLGLPQLFMELIASTAEDRLDLVRRVLVVLFLCQHVLFCCGVGDIADVLGVAAGHRDRNHVGRFGLYRNHPRHGRNRIVLGHPAERRLGVQIVVFVGRPQCLFAADDVAGVGQVFFSHDRTDTCVTSTMDDLHHHFGTVLRHFTLQQHVANTAAQQTKQDDECFSTPQKPKQIKARIVFLALRQDNLSFNRI